jgi:small GTP-binding protein
MNLVSWLKTKLTQYNSINKSSTILGYLQYKILILGEPEVGKTSLCVRFISNEFNLEIKPSKASECFCKDVTLFQEKIRILLIDVDSNVLNLEHSQLYEHVKGVIVVYDVTKYKSFEKVDNWVLDMRKSIGYRTPILIVGNKNDLEYLKCVHERELKEKAEELNCDYMETTCTDIESVDKAVKFMIGKIFYLDLPPNKQNYLRNYLQE